ncbi:MAG: hypothetical protein IJB70_09795 [Clostridia bacterium]|nr:hypothetical protein [Clostridia bacterium]
MAEKLVIDKNAADNEYFHRDFHISGDRGVRYVGENYGDDAVVKYLEKFTKAYYSPLIAKIKTDGLKAMKEHIENIYAVEKYPDNVACTLDGEKLLVEVSECPAVKYMKESGYEPSKWYVMLTSVVNDVIAKECGYNFEMISYSEENGAASYKFFK